MPDAPAPAPPPPPRPARRAARRLRVLTANILLGGRGRADLIAGVLERCDADVIALQEASDLHLVNHVADRLGMTAVIGEPSDAASRLNLVLLSRLPVRRFENHQHHGMLRTHLACELRLPSRRLPAVRIHIVHLAASFGERYNGEVRRMREIQWVLGDMARWPEGPHLIVGDFNAVAPNDVVAATAFFTRMAALRAAGLVVRTEDGFMTPIRRPDWDDPTYDERWRAAGIHPRLDVGIPRLPWVVGPATRLIPEHPVADRFLNLRIRRDTMQHLARSGYTDCYRRLHPDPGWTCATWLPAARIDYILADEAMSRRLVACDVVGGARWPDEDAACASDHFPLVADFRFPAADVRR